MDMYSRWVKVVAKNAVLEQRHTVVKKTVFCLILKKMFNIFTQQHFMKYHMRFLKQYLQDNQASLFKVVLIDIEQ